MYNGRYHLVSLAAVFLALAMGLILGGLVVQRGSVEAGQEQLVDELRQEFADLRSENRRLSEEVGVLSDLSATLVDDWGAGRLADRTVVVLVDAERDAAARPVVTAVESAGGRAEVLTLRSPGLGLASEDVSAAVAPFVPVGEPADEALATRLGRELASGGPRPVTDALVEAGVLRGDIPAEPADGLVVLSVFDDAADGASIHVADAFSETAPAIGVQTPEVDTGVAEAADRAGISAVDTLGTQIGRYSLIALLAGAEPGHYGTGSRAIAAFPPLAP